MTTGVNYFKQNGYQILDALDRYHPFPSDEVKKSQAVYGGSWSHINLPSISFVDRSWNWGSRTEVHVHADTQETPEQREAREKREREEHRNRLVMIASGIGSVVAAYFVGKQYQEYCHFDKRSKGLQTFIVNHEIYDVKNSAVPTINMIGRVFGTYRDVYNKQLRKMKTYFVLKTALFVELTALCISAFYKKIPLRDGIGVATFITVALTALYYGMTHNSESQWKNWIKTHDHQIPTIREAIFMAINTPPSYQEAVDQKCKQQYIDAGYTVPQKDGQNVVWTQHKDSSVWLYFSPQQNAWISTLNYVPQLNVV